MTKSFVLFIGLLVLLNSLQTTTESLPISAIFNKLQLSKTGQNVYNTIVLELQSDSTEHVVDKILNLLRQLKEEAESALESSKCELEKQKDLCENKPCQLSDEITIISDRVAVAQSVIPGKQGDYRSKAKQLQDLLDLKTRNQENLQSLLDSNENSITLFKKDIENSNILIEALFKAKKLIEKLQNGGRFLQERSTEKSLAELKKHSSQQQDIILSDQHLQIFNSLMQLAMKTEVMADPTKVNSVLDIIDDLIMHQNDFKQVKIQGENLRKMQFEYDYNREIKKTKFLDGFILQIQADMKNIEVQLNELGDDIGNWKKSINDKTVQIEDIKRSCSSKLSEVQNFYQSTNEQLEVIKQVILIFESKSIQDIKKEIDLQV